MLPLLIVLCHSINFHSLKCLDTMEHSSVSVEVISALPLLRQKQFSQVKSLLRRNWEQDHSKLDGPSIQVSLRTSLGNRTCVLKST